MDFQPSLGYIWMLVLIADWYQYLKDKSLAEDNIKWNSVYF